MNRTVKYLNLKEKISPTEEVLKFCKDAGIKEVDLRFQEGYVIGAIRSDKELIQSIAGLNKIYFFAGLWAASRETDKRFFDKGKLKFEEAARELFTTRKKGNLDYFS